MPTARRGGLTRCGQEAAASLVARGLEVHVVASGARPLERVMGPALGDAIRPLHEGKRVRFHMGETVTVAFRSDGRNLAVACIGRDRTSLQAERALERRDEAALHELVPPS